MRNRPRTARDGALKLILQMCRSFAKVPEPRRPCGAIRQTQSGLVVTHPAEPRFPRVQGRTSTPALKGGAAQRNVPKKLRCVHQTAPGPCMMGGCVRERAGPDAPWPHVGPVELESTTESHAPHRHRRAKAKQEDASPRLKAPSTLNMETCGEHGRYTHVLP